MSAFYLFASLGFYPIPGSDRWVLGSPLFPRATLAIPNGTLTIDAPGASKKTRFPRSTTLNGKAVGGEVRHADLANATLRFEMAK
jgi:putative alpha-1,2-mannosidase